MAGGGAGVAHLRGSRFLNAHQKLSPADLKAALASEAHALGFDCVGVTDPAAIAEAGAHFHAFLDAGAHGDMEWLAAHPERRTDPRVLWGWDPGKSRAPVPTARSEFMRLFEAWVGLAGPCPVQ